MAKIIFIYFCQPLDFKIINN